jgi:hypothetical protein
MNSAINHRLSVLLGALLLSACGSDTPAKTETAAKESARSGALKDEPVVVADGSVRLLFRGSAFPVEALSPVYGCCLAAPAVRGKKEVRVYAPASPGATAIKLDRQLDLNEADVLQFFLERKTETGWLPYDKDRFPAPQIAFFRRDLSNLETIKEAQYAEYVHTGKTSWVIAAEMTPKAIPDRSPLAKSMGIRHEYQMGGKALRLGRAVLRRADNSQVEIPLGSGCAAVEICSQPNCLTSVNSPCAERAP